MDEHRVDEHDGDATLLRPAVDPAIPKADRYLLLTHGTSAKTLGLLPLEPERRLATVSGAATGLTAGVVIAVTGVAPWAFGVLVFQGAVAWQTATGRWALMIMELIVAATVMVVGAQVARFDQFRDRYAAAAARSKYRGRYLTGADIDVPARVLLRRAQAAIDAVAAAEVSRAGLLDDLPALAAQEWDIAVTLREQSGLRARRREAAGSEVAVAHSAAADLLLEQVEAARMAEQSIASRIAALERYADEVRAADGAYRAFQARARLAELSGPHLDMLARTAADAHGIAELTEMTERARAIRDALREDD